MHYLNFLYPALLATSTLISGGDALRSDSKNKVKLSNVQSLTLRKGLKTSHRRVSSIPQLRCVGGSAKPYYEVDVMRCKNSGADYNEEDIQWTCTASLPEEFKLGSTDVICEGYDYPDDPYILKGSCGVEYRLVLTEKGEQKYGKKKGWFGDGDGEHGRHHPKTFGEQVAAALFWMLFIGVALYIVYSAWTQRNNQPGVVGGTGNRPGWGGGGGGGGGDNGWDDPPPPYDWRPSQGPKRDYGSAQQGWRPGFWSGALGGAAAGYAAGRSGNRNNTNSGWGGGWGSNQGGGRWDNGEGSSSSSSSPGYSSTRHESTGFGSTSRR